MTNTIEEYAEELFKIEQYSENSNILDKLSWDYCIRNKIYINPTTLDAYKDTFRDHWVYYVNALLTTNANLSKDRIFELINKVPDCVYNNNTITQLYLHGIRDFSKVAPRKTLNADLQIIGYIKAFRANNDVFDLNSVMNFGKYFTCANDELIYNVVLLFTLKYRFPSERIEVPENIHIHYNVIENITRYLSKDEIKEKWLDLILRDKTYIRVFLEHAQYSFPEFEGKIDEILIGIYTKDESKINNKTFEQCSNKLDIALAYVSEYNKAPPEWMCKEDKHRIIELLDIYGCNVPDYLCTSTPLTCAHYDKDKYYLNTDTNEIKCEKCYANCAENNLKIVYNIKCLICFEEHPTQIHRFECGHTLCLDCYKRKHMCPLCDREVLDSDSDSDSDLDSVD